MSLINRMLRDLSTRQPEAGDVMGGIELRGPERRSSGRALVWILLLGIAGFTAVFLWTQPKNAAVPGTRGPAIASAAPVVPAATAPTTAAPPAAPARLKIDPTMSPPVGGPAPSKASPARHRSKPAKPPAPETAAPAASAPPPEAVTPHEAATSHEPSRPVGAGDTRNAQARYAEARHALAAGREKDAEQALTAALALDPKLHKAREDLGSLLIGQGRFDEAEHLVQRGLEESPDWIGYRRLSARLALARGQPGEALALLDHAQPSVVSDPEFHGLLAAAYQRLNRHADAARAYQALVDAQPDEGHWWAGLGISRDALGDVPGALAAYGKARSLGNLDARLVEHVNRRMAALQSSD